MTLDYSTREGGFGGEPLVPRANRISHSTNRPSLWCKQPMVHGC